jgi:hypothetical protein
MIVVSRFHLVSEGIQDSQRLLLEKNIETLTNKIDTIEIGTEIKLRCLHSSRIRC